MTKNKDVVAGETDRKQAMSGGADNDALDETDSEFEEEDFNQHDFEMEQLLNMFRIPIYLEKFMLFTLLASYDWFLYYFTELPYNVCRYHVRSIKNSLLSILGRNKKQNKVQSLPKQLKKQLKEQQSKMFQDKCTMLLIIASSILLSPLDTSKVYHRIKRQSTVKLYVLFSLLEMSDQLLSSVGQSLLTVVISHNCYKRLRHRQFFLLFLGVVYLTCHGYVLVYQTISLNIATNSCSNALLTLLLSMQFSEIKGSVFKKIDKEGLFQIGMSDVAERFKLLLFLSIIGLRNIVAKSRNISSVIPFTWCLNITSSGIQNSPTLNVIGSEIIVDWIKHAYITKFNRIRPEMYDKFYFIAYRDYTQNGTQYQNRLGIPLPASVVLFLTMLRPVFFQPAEDSSGMLSIVITLLGSAVIILLSKTLLHWILVQWSRSIQRRFPDGEYNTMVNSESYVPGIISTGLSKMDEITRELINYEKKTDSRSPSTDSFILSRQSPQSSREATPEPHTDSSDSNRDASLLPIPILTNTATPDQSLEGVTKYKMVSKRIW
ncbi:uncharacterized protein GWK60_I02343 [Nakaseomyces glabratus]|nr:uncharacterized protein GWK60_I02343 [Nakaseomyces glabratus]